MRQKTFDTIPARLTPLLAPEDRGVDFAVSPEYYDWYAVYASTWKPKRILEIGSRYGYSALAMVWGSDTIKELVLIDNGSYGVPVEAAVKTIVKGAGRPLRIHTRAEDTQKMTNIGEWGKFDLIHIDGDHTPNGLDHDLGLCLPVLADDGVMVVDDVTWHPELWSVAARFAGQNELTMEFIPTFRGHILLYRPVAGGA